MEVGMLFLASYTWCWGIKLAFPFFLLLFLCLLTKAFSVSSYLSFGCWVGSGENVFIKSSLVVTGLLLNFRPKIHKLSA